MPRNTFQSLAEWNEIFRESLSSGITFIGVNNSFLDFTPVVYIIKDVDSYDPIIELTVLSPVGSNHISLENYRFFDSISVEFPMFNNGVTAGSFPVFASQLEKWNITFRLSQSNHWVPTYGKKSSRVVLKTCPSCKVQVEPDMLGLCPECTWDLKGVSVQ